MGEGIRARRRQTDGIYEWAVYSLVYGIDESASGTSDSFTLSSSRYKRAASAYTVSADGTVSLTNSTQKTAANLAVGDYIVNVSTSNNTSTTGTKLYKITSKSVSGTTYTINYIAYTPKKILKGEDTGERVTSTTLDYPVDGKQGNYWYVMISGSYLAYVWDVFEDVGSYKSSQTTNQDVSIPSGTTIYYRPDRYGNTSWTIDKETGLFTYSGWSSYKTSSSNNCLTASDANVFDNEWTLETSPATNIYSGTAVTFERSARAEYCYTGVYEGVKGDATGNTVESADVNAYPQNGAQDGYWYVFVRSYKKRL